jgi:bacteriorhodopsin
MRQWWDKYKKNPVFYRYIDWFLTVPLQIIEFYVILSISETVPSYLLVSLLTSSFLMILFGFLGETGRMNRNVAFTLGFVMWLYIIYEIFFGTGAQIESKTTNKNVKLAFNAMKWIVTIGWSIYPIGYMLNNKWMSVVYNFGDLINKILFVGVIWYAGSQDSK